MSVTMNRTQGARLPLKTRARAYRYRLTDMKSWQVYIGPVRNREEAIRALKDLFDERLAEVRVHPVCDPWPKVRKMASEQRTARP